MIEKELKAELDKLNREYLRSVDRKVRQRYGDPKADEIPWPDLSQVQVHAVLDRRVHGGSLSTPSLASGSA